MFGKKGEQTHQIDMEVFTIFDTKTGSYRDPVFSVNTADMTREILNVFRNPQQRNNPLFLNAEDFQVYKIGTWSRKEGYLSSFQPAHVVNLHDLKSLVDREQSVPGIVPT